MHVVPTTSPTVLVMRADEPAPTQRPPLSPGSAAWGTFGHWFLDMPGAISVSHNSAEPTVVRVRMETPELAAIGRAAFRDVIDGATILWEARGELPTTPPGELPYNWWENPSNAARAIGGLNGIVRMDRGMHGVGLWAEDDATVLTLRRALRPEIVPGYHVNVNRLPHPPRKPTPMPLA